VTVNWIRCAPNGEVVSARDADSGSDVPASEGDPVYMVASPVCISHRVKAARPRLSATTTEELKPFSPAFYLQLVHHGSPWFGRLHVDLRVAQRAHQRRN